MRLLRAFHTSERNPFCTVVGSIGTTAQEGDHVKRGDELGWFAFGEHKMAPNRPWTSLMIVL